MKSVSKAIARLEKVTPNQTESVLEEFCQSALGGGGRGGFDYAKRMLSSAFGPEGARRLAEASAQRRRQGTRTLNRCRKRTPPC